MIGKDELSRRLGVGPRQRARRLGDAVARRLRAELWFPHVPLFLAVVALGLLQLAPLARGGLGIAATVGGLLSLSQSVLDATIRGAPKVVVGVFLLIMALGLLTRSRLAWVITLLVASASLALYLLTGSGPRYAGLIAYNVILLACLLLGYRHFQRSSIATATLFAITSVVSLLAYAVVGTYVLGAQFGPPIQDVITALYFAVVSMSTVGYGDISPKTPEARLFVVSIILLGITVFATSLSALLVPLINRRVQLLLRPRGDKMERADHYIIVSDSALARNSYKELRARGQPVTFILARAGEPDGEDLDTVIGDASDLDVLRRAGAQSAKAILALGDDDSENAFVVLAAKELASTVKTVAVVNDARNLARVKRVHPDLIIAPHILGGELLAMALSGEEVQGDHLMKQLLHFGDQPQGA